MLLSHLNAIEKVLLAQSHAARNAGHPNLRGGPREWFVREFLENHLPANLEIGQGEIIDADSKPNPPRGSYRPQADIVVYRKDMPRISYSRGNAAYLSEGVMAVIEVKSTMTKNHLYSACDASNTHKSLCRMEPVMRTGWIPDHIMSYVVAYRSRAKISSLATWLSARCRQTAVSHEKLVDLVVVLGKGIVWNINSFPALPLDDVPEGHNWGFVDQVEGNLFTLFAHMLSWAASTSTTPSTLQYAKRAQYRNIQTV